MSDEKIYYCPHCGSLEIINYVEILECCDYNQIFFNKKKLLLLL